MSGGDCFAEEGGGEANLEEKQNFHGGMVLSLMTGE